MDAQLPGAVGPRDERDLGQRARADREAAHRLRAGFVVHFDHLQRAARPALELQQRPAGARPAPVSATAISWLLQSPSTSSGRDRAARRRDIDRARRAEAQPGVLDARSARARPCRSRVGHASLRAAVAVEVGDQQVAHRLARTRRLHLGALAHRRPCRRRTYASSDEPGPSARRNSASSVPSPSRSRDAHAVGALGEALRRRRVREALGPCRGAPAGVLSSAHSATTSRLAVAVEVAHVDRVRRPPDCAPAAHV